MNAELEKLTVYKSAFFHQRKISLIELAISEVYDGIEI